MMLAADTRSKLPLGPTNGTSTSRLRAQRCGATRGATRRPGSSSSDTCASASNAPSAASESVGQCARPNPAFRCTRRTMPSSSIGSTM